MHFYKKKHIYNIFYLILIIKILLIIIFILLILLLLTKFLILKNFILLLIIFNITSLFAQNIDLKWSEKLIQSKEDLNLADLVINDTGIHALFIDDIDNRLLIKHYDFDLNFIKKKKIEVDIYGKGFSLIKAIGAKDKLIINFSKFFKESDKIVVYGTVLNNDYQTSPVKILEEINDTRYIEYLKSDISQDHTKLIYVTKLKSDDKKIFKYSVKVYDTLLENIYSETILKLANKDSAKINSFKVDNNGNAYLVTLSNEEVLNEKGKKSIENILNLNIIKNTSGEYLTYSLLNSDYKINSITVNQIDNNIVAVTTFGANKNEISKKERDKNYIISYYKFNTDTFEFNEPQIIDIGHLIPSDDTFNDRLPYEFSQIVKHDNGKISLVGEQYKHLLIQTTDRNGVPITYTKYYYCDIMNLNLDHDLNVDNLAMIPKYQTNLDFASFIATSFNNKTYIVYEDKNEHADLINTVVHIGFNNPYKRKKNALQMAVIDQDGKPLKRKIQEYKKVKKEFLFNVKRSKNLGNGKILYLGLERLALLQIK